MIDVKIERRGCLAVDRNLLPDMSSKLIEHHLAVGKDTGGYGSTTFEVWQSVANNKVLIPRYTPLLPELLKHKQFATNLESKNFGEPNTRFQWSPDKPLHDVQKPGADKAFEALKTQRGCLIKGDTGSGKTVIGLNMIYRFQPKTALVLVDQLDIAKQWADRIREFMPSTRIEFLVPKKEAMLMMAKLAPIVGAPSDGVIYIGTAQSMHRTTQYSFNNPLCVEMLLCDEVHVFGAPTFISCLYKINYALSIGLTATDDRKDGLDWVFRQALGVSVVEFAGKVWSLVVIQLFAPDCGLRSEEWQMAFCQLKHRMTCLARCADCSEFSQFPKKCGGNLPMTSTGKVKWGNLNRVALIQEWCNSKEYQDWLMLVIDQLVKKKRNIFVFGDSRAFLLSLYEKCVAKYGQKYTGIFLGKGPVLEGEKDVSWQRDTALAKPITFATYGVARKALDVVAKDAAILATPISDARQVAGRIRRVAKDKAQPILLVPVAMKIKMFRDAWNKIKLQFEAAGWEIKLCS